MEENCVAARLKVGTYMSCSDAISLMAKTNPEDKDLDSDALDCLLRIAISEGSQRVIDRMVLLDRMGIYGKDIGIFWTKICKKNMDSFHCYVDSFGLGIISKDQVQQRLADFQP